MLIAIAFVLGVVVGWFGPGLLVKLLKPMQDSDPHSALKAYQRMKEERG